MHRAPHRTQRAPVFKRCWRRRGLVGSIALFTIILFRKWSRYYNGDGPNRASNGRLDRCGGLTMTVAPPIAAPSAATLILMACAVLTGVAVSGLQGAFAQSDPFAAAAQYALRDLLVPTTAIGRADVSDAITTSPDAKQGQSSSREERGADPIPKAYILGLRGGAARAGEKLNLRINTLPVVQGGDLGSTRGANDTLNPTSMDHGFSPHPGQMLTQEAAILSKTSKLMQDTHSTMVGSSDTAIASTPSSASTTVGQVTINVDGVAMSWQSSSGETWATFEKEVGQISLSRGPRIAVPLKK